jgi:hypothetical protein
MIEDSKILGSAMSSSLNRSSEDDSDQGPISQRIFIGRLPEDCAGRDLDDLCGYVDDENFPDFFFLLRIFHSTYSHCSIHHQLRDKLRFYSNLCSFI